MKFLSLFLAAAFCLALGTASAQGCAHDHAAASASPAKAKAALLNKELGLTADQNKQVDELLTAAEGQMAHQHAEGASAAKGEARYDRTYDRIARLLTAEQAEKFKQLRADGRLAACGTEAGGGKACCAGHGAAGAKAGCCSGKGKVTTQEAPKLEAH
ncbi:MAG: hypothetical protein QM724_07230 [Flavobacteriales bacterium]